MAKKRVFKKENAETIKSIVDLGVYIIFQLALVVDLVVRKYKIHKKDKATYCKTDYKNVYDADYKEVD